MPKQAQLELKRRIQAFAAGNSDRRFQPLENRAKRKNAIVVGNSLNRRLNEGDGADDIRGLRASSSRGPAVDTRIRPDVMAPGTDITSAS
ncbi:MAG: S8 family serine peptidase [Flavobacteriales bacterium]|nr:S8 family serine peptidase [Flavobacteriales bacterium]